MHLPALLPLLPTLLLPALTLAANDVQTELLIERTLTHSCTRKSKSGDTIHAHYRGTLATDGKQFDASYDRGTPLSFKLGAGRVIRGWDLGLTEMCPGDKRTLTIPPELGYGSRGMGPIPANSVLVFETELVSIDGVAPEEKVVVPKEQVPDEEKHLEDVPTADAQMDVIDQIKDEAAVQKDAVEQAEAERLAKDAAKAAEDAKEKVAGEPEVAKTEPEQPVQQENPQEELEKEKKEDGKDEL